MPVLYDHRGEPIRPGELRDEVGAPRLGSVRSSSRLSAAAGLTPARLARLFRQADEGDTEAFFTLAEEMEERDLHYRSVVSTRKLAVSGAPVQVEAASDDAIDQEIADVVREELVEHPGFEGLAMDLLDGIAKGVSPVEILWDTKGSLWVPKSFEHRDPRWFAWDQNTLSRPLLRTDANPIGEELAGGKWIVHVPKLKTGLPLRGGLARVAAIAYMLKSFTVRDWMAFLEVFGMPIRVGKYGPQSTPEDRRILLRAVTSIGHDAAAIIPESMKVDFINSGTTSGGEKLFQGNADWWDRQVSKVVLGQTMTTDDGSSRAQAQVHDDVRLDIRAADSRSANATIHRDLTSVFVRLNYGPNRRPPRIRIVVEEPEDLEKYMTTVAAFVQVGGEVEQSVVRDKLGLPDPEPGAKLLSPRAPAVPPNVGTPGGPGAPAAPGSPGSPATPAAPDDDVPPEPTGAGPAEVPDALNQRLDRLEGIVLRAMNRAARPGDDAIDELVGVELDDWRRVVAPSIGSLTEELEHVATADEARAVLERARESMDLESFTDALATAMLKARGLGDFTDSVT